MHTPTSSRTPSRRRVWTLLSALVFFTPASLSFAAGPFWVSPSGSNSNPGTEQQPWLTIQKARDHIRQNGLNQNMAADIVVNIKAGDYPVTSAISFGVADSGSNNRHVIYRSVDGPGAARIRSGVRLTGWQAGDLPNTYKKSVGTGLTIRSLYEDGKLAVLARSPNRVENPRYPGAKGDYKLTQSGGDNGNGTAWVQYQSGDYNPSAWVLTGQSVFSWWFDKASSDPSKPKPDWGIQTVPLLGVDAVNRMLTFTKDHFVPGVADRYYVQGILALLDAPGEFFYNPSNGWLHYYPRSGAPDTRDVRLPGARRLIEFKGSGIGAHVHHIKLEGLALSETIPHGGDREVAWSDPSAGVFLRHSNNIVIRDCLLERLGTFGVLMVEDNHHNRIEGCLIRNCGAGGIWVQNALNRTTYPNARSEFHVVTNCKIHDYTEYVIGSHGGGVYLECVSDTTVSHCEIFNAGRYALSLRGHCSTEWDGNLNTISDRGYHPARGNVFEYIRAMDTVTDSGDAGIVHAAHCNSTAAFGHDGNINTWRQLLISGGYNDDSSLDIKPDGIFMDHPYSAVDQVFSNVHVAWVEGTQFRDNVNASQTTSNVSWLPGFDPAQMEYAKIGLTNDFPVQFDARADIIADDHTIDHTEVGGGWVDTAIGQLHKGDGRYNKSNSAAQYADWHAVLPRAGDYEVQVWKMASDANASTAAKYRVYHATGDTLYLVNQVTPSDTWQTLGRHTFRSGRTGRVRLTADGGVGKAVRADAVRFVYLGAPSDDHARWTLDGNGNDSAGLGAANTLTLNNGLGYVSGGKFGSALSFNNVEKHYATAADHADLDIGTGDFAISGWFYRTANPAENLRLLSKGAGGDALKGYAVWASNTTVVASLGNGSTRRYASVRYSGLNMWHHFAVNVDRGGQLVVYVDGIATSTPANIADWAGLDLGNTVPFNLGRNDSGEQYWPGRLDHIRIYKRLLAPEEIAALILE